MEGRTAERIMFNRIKCAHFPFVFLSSYLLHIIVSLPENTSKKGMFYMDKGSELFYVTFYFHFVWQVCYHLRSVNFVPLLISPCGVQSSHLIPLFGCWHCLVDFTFVTQIDLAFITQISKQKTNVRPSKELGNEWNARLSSASFWTVCACVQK